VGLEGEVDVDHPELVAIAVSAAAGALAGAEVAVLLGLELGLARPVSEDVESLLLGHGDELGGGVGTGLLGGGDLGGLL
jgi:hypothetical protein